MWARAGLGPGPRGGRLFLHSYPNVTMDCRQDPHIRAVCLSVIPGTKQWGGEEWSPMPHGLGLAPPPKIWASKLGRRLACMAECPFPTSHPQFLAWQIAHGSELLLLPTSVRNVRLGSGQGGSMPPLPCCAGLGPRTCNSGLFSPHHSPLLPSPGHAGRGQRPFWLLSVTAQVQSWLVACLEQTSTGQS